MTQIRRPLVVALIAFLVGLLPALRFGPPPDFPAATLILALVGLAVDLVTGHRSRLRLERHLLVLAFVGAGALSGTLARHDSLIDCRTTFEDDASLRVRGRLTAAYRRANGPAAAPLVPLRAEAVNGTEGCAVDLRVRLPPTHPSAPIGAELDLVGIWRVSADFANGGRGWPTPPHVRGFFLADSVVSVTTGSSNASPWLRLRAAADHRLERLFDRHLPLVEALLLGRREYVDPSVRDRYARAGLSHLLAISGMHVGLLAGTLLIIATAVRASRRRAIYFTLATTWVYLIVIGAPPSAIRAGTMISLGLLAILLQRPAAATAIVAAAALAILSFRPLAVLDPGFQLSFAGVLGILLLRPALLTVAPDRLHRRGPLRNIVDSVVVGIAAFLATAPIVAHHFGVIAAISIVAGPPAVPLMSLALVGAAAALVIDPILPSLAAILATGAGTALDGLDRLAAIAASVPYGHGAVPRPPMWSWAIAAAIGLAAARVLVRPTRRLRWIVGSGATIAVLVIWPLLGPDRADDLEIHFIDVGQGDAVAIRTPLGRWVLIDAGPATDGFDAGERRILPFLRDRRARGIEALVLTHPDLDHIGGAPSILRSIPVAFVFEPGLAVGKASYLEVLGMLEVRGTEWRAARSGRSMELDGVHFDFLWPDPETIDGDSEANQISAVVRVSFGDFAALLTGDADALVEDLLVDRYGTHLRAQLLKLGHHGSATSTTERFLDAVRPELAVVSAGRRNRYGHPDRAVVARVQDRGIPISRTDLDGTIGVVVAEGGVEWRLRP